MISKKQQAAVLARNPIYTLSMHTEKMNGLVLPLFELVRSYILSLHNSVQEVPKQKYIGYKAPEYFVFIQAMEFKLKVFLKLDPGRVTHIPGKTRDVSSIAHFATGDLECIVRSKEDMAWLEPLIAKSYKTVEQ